MQRFIKEKPKSGFTLIELLVVVLVIGVLSGVVVSVINTGGIRQKARDSQRIADLGKVQAALELYFSDYRSYPVNDTGEAAIIGSAIYTAVVGGGYLNVFPTDPTPASSPESFSCAKIDNYRYNYRSISSGGEYVLTAIMEVASSNDDSKCSELSNWVSGWCATFETDDYCYGVQNP